MNPRFSFCFARCILLVLGGALPLPAGAASLQLDIRHEIDGAPLEFRALRYRNAAGESYSVARLSYFLSGFGLRGADGAWAELPESVAWIDAPSGRIRVTLDAVPPGEYEALRFHVGLDPASNASDPASHAPDHPLNPNLNGLHWAWMGGYIFMAFEGLYGFADDAAPRGYAWHLARDSFRAGVVLEGRLDLRRDAEIAVSFDVAALFDGAVPLSLARDGASTHSKDGDPVAVGMRRNLGGAFRLETGGSEAPAEAAGGARDGAGDSGVAGQARADLQPAGMFSVPASFPRTELPADNPLSVERIRLGRDLFHETALSVDGTISCASCHVVAAALSDPRRVSLGVRGQAGHRQAMPLFNLAWKREFFWDGRAPSLRAQAVTAIADPTEMGESLEVVVAKLHDGGEYGAAFEKAFGTREVTGERIGLAIENFLLTLTSHDSKFDRAQSGLEKLSAEEQRGFELFTMEREPRMGTLGADCFHCHGGPLFTDHQFRNNGLAIDENDTGRHRVTGSPLDRGTFATPSLRNIALTAPYMHDGRFATLEEVLDHYSEGVQRTDTLDPNLAKHPDGGLGLTAEDKRAVIAFLRTLTDRRFLDAEGGPAGEVSGVSSR